MLVAPTRLGRHTLADLADAARERPGELTYASAGVGTGTHLSVAQLNLDLALSAVHAPARPTDAIADTIGRVAAGEADYAMSPIPIALPHLADGSLVALGVSSSRRSRLLTDVPTLAEAGAPGFDFPVWYGIWAPSAVPEPIVTALATAIRDAVESPEFISWLDDHGAEPMRMSKQEFVEFIHSETDRATPIAVAMADDQPTA